MRRNLILLATAVGALALPGAALAEDIGFVAATEGDVDLARGGSDTFEAAQRDGGVAIGDRIRTGLDSSAKIVLVDDTLLQIDEDTDLRIETFHVGAAATQQPSILRQTRGRIRATVGNAFGGSTKLEVHTPTAAVGVKGTDFEVIKGVKEWEACLISGGIIVKNEYGEASPRPGECVYAYADKAPGDPFKNPRTPFEAGDSDDFGSSSDDVAGDDPGQPDLPTDPFDDGGDDDEFQNPVLDPIDPPEIDQDDPQRKPIG